jgi:hypothetical protein
LIGERRRGRGRGGERGARCGGAAPSPHQCDECAPHQRRWRRRRVQATLAERHSINHGRPLRRIVNASGCHSLIRVRSAQLVAM